MEEGGYLRHHAGSLSRASGRGKVVAVVLEVSALEEHVCDESGFLSLFCDLVGGEGFVDGGCSADCVCAFGCEVTATT